MKNLSTQIAVIASLLFAIHAHAQEQTYLFKDSTQLGGYIGPGYQMTAIGGQYSGQFTIRGGFALNNKFALGIHVAEMMNDMNPKQVPDDVQLPEGSEIDIAYNEAGIDFLYSPKSMDMFHLSYGVAATWGKVQLTGDETNYGRASVACVIPQINFGVNLLPWMKFQAGFGYRIASELKGLEEFGLGSRSMNAPNVQFGVYLGRY